MPGRKTSRPKSQSSRKTSNKPPARRERQPRPPSIRSLAEPIARGGKELLTLDDPLLAELWGSMALGTFYKLPVPLDVRADLERELVPTIITLAETKGDEAALAVLEAFAAVLDPEPAAEARAAADRLHAGGIPRPRWAAELGTAAFERAWIVTDVFDDHEAWYAEFRYPGRDPHVVNALYDKAMGNIIKDAFVGYAREDMRAAVVEVSTAEPGLTVSDAESSAMARRVVDAIENGDLYLDNDWTDTFKQMRALLLTRMRSLPIAPPPPEREPLDDDVRDALIDEFLASGLLPGRIEKDVAEILASHCIDYPSDYLGDDPLRWSPIVVEMFLLDFLPRKVALDMQEIRAFPDVLRAWVRFALVKRGLEERFVAEAEEAVAQNEKEFRSSVTDTSNFGPAKEIFLRMSADGVDMSDERAVAEWIEAYNERQAGTPRDD